MQILELKQTSPERFTIKLDDGSEIKTTLAVVTERFLHSGKELTCEELNEIMSDSSLSLAKARAMRIINMRSMSAKEMRDKLIEKGESAADAETAAEWLCEMGLINDKSYAGTVVRHYAAKGYGVSRIKQELRRHGVPSELWDEALTEMPEQDDYLERFIRTRISDFGDKAQIKKVSDALFRRGYSWEQIKHALRSFEDL